MVAGGWARWRGPCRGGFRVLVFRVLDAWGVGDDLPDQDASGHAPIPVVAALVGMDMDTFVAQLGHNGIVADDLTLSIQKTGPCGAVLPGLHHLCCGGCARHILVNRARELAAQRAMRSCISARSGSES